MRLVSPGLLGHLPRLGELGVLPRFPNLELILSRARSFPAPVGYPQTLWQLFGLPESADLKSSYQEGGGKDLPTAAVCYQAELCAGPLSIPGSEPVAEAENVDLQGRCLLHADPVFLRPDQDRLLAFDFHHGTLTAEEAATFSAVFNAHFEADGLQLLTPHPSRWYLASDSVPELATRPLSDVLGRNIDWYLPQGRDARRWRGWMNEIQMLFHALPVNEARVAKGLLPVSGLWFSGVGQLPDRTVRGFAEVEGGCLLVDGLQALASSHCNQTLVLEHAPGRAVLDADPERWLESVRLLDQRLAELMKHPLTLHPCDGAAWEWVPGMRWHLWRKVHPLSHWVSTDSGDE